MKQILEKRKPHNDPNDVVSCESDIDCKEISKTTSCNNETLSEIIPGRKDLALEFRALIHTMIMLQALTINDITTI